MGSSASAPCAADIGFGIAFSQSGRETATICSSSSARRARPVCFAAGRWCIGPAVRIAWASSDVTPDGTRRFPLAPGHYGDRARRHARYAGSDTVQRTQRRRLAEIASGWPPRMERSGRLRSSRLFLDERERATAHLDGGTRSLWAPSGRRLFYVAADGALVAVRRPPAVAWRNGSPSKSQGPYSTLSSQSPRTYDVSRDGTRFVIVKQPATQIAAQIVVVRIGPRS